jgi:hypothetical protein
MKKPDGTYFCLYRGRIHLRDHDGLVVTGYDEAELEEVNRKAAGGVEAQMLNELLYWEIQATAVGDLATYLGGLLTARFDIRMKLIEEPKKPPKK